MKKTGRFTKVEIVELASRYTAGQSLYKIGREMRRSQSSVRGHLINLGLMKDKPVVAYSNSHSKTFILKPLNFDFIILSFLLIVLPSLGIIYVGLMLIKD